MVQENQEQQQAVFVLHCTCPGCETEAPPERMRVPAWDALKAANSGKRVYARDLARFAVCGKCGYQLKEFGIKTFPYPDAFLSASKREEDEAQAEADRIANRAKEEEKALRFRAFAEAFMPKGSDAKPAPAAQLEGSKTGKTANKRARRLAALAAKRGAQPAAQPAAPATTDVVPDLAEPAASPDAQPAPETAEEQAIGDNSIARA